MITSKKINVRFNRQGFTLIELLVVIAIMGTLAGVGFGPIMARVKDGKRMAAIASGKNLYSALSGFAADNDGIFPSDETAANYPGATTGGKTSASYLNQLLLSEQIEKEKMFWNTANAGLLGLKKPNEDGILTGDECAWGYVVGLYQTSKSSYPILFDSSTDGVTFDTSIWGKKALIVRLDSSCEALTIVSKQGEDTGKIMFKVKGKDKDGIAGVIEGKKKLKIAVPGAGDE